MILIYDLQKLLREFYKNRDSLSDKTISIDLKSYEKLLEIQAKIQIKLKRKVPLAFIVYMLLVKSDGK